MKKVYLFFAFLLQNSGKKITFAFVIELDRHIEILLLSNDCVIVPNFGGFMVHHVDACYDEEEKLFFPPSRTLGFNPQLTMNDSLLVQSYIATYDISYPDALKAIEKDVNELRQHIDHDGHYDIIGIGKLVLNSTGSIVFEPCEAGILTTELYGLSSFEISRRQVLPQPGLSTDAITVETKAVNVTSNDEHTEEEHYLVASTIDDEHTSTYSIKVWRNIAAACVAILCFFLASTPLDNHDSTLVKSKIDTHLLDQIIPKEMIGNLHSAKFTRTEKQPATQRKITARDTSSVVCKYTGSQYFTIVLASHVTKKNASVFIHQLHHKGFPLASLYTKNKVNRVIYGKYASMNKAYNALCQLHHHDDFSEAWILKLRID